MAENCKMHLPIKLGSIPRQDASGTIIGLIQLIKFLGRNYKDDAVYLCKDIFGVECSVCYANLHGANKLYLVAKESIAKKVKLSCCYYDMLGRCYNPDRKNYQSYGAVGVKVCDEWLGENGYYNFIRWAAISKFQIGLSIDKRDKLYSPNTCRWVTRIYNSRYKDNNKVTKEIVLAIREEFKTLKTPKMLFYKKWAEKLGCHYNNVILIAKGKLWSDEVLNQTIQ